MIIKLLGLPCNFIIMNSHTEENYLKAIYYLDEQDKNEKVTVQAIAERMNIKPSSVSEMLKKLTEKKLMNHEKYYGINLTDKGKKTAVGIIRKHRLWEVFLVDKLGFKWNEVHDIAEQLEHINSDELTEKLDKFLGHPKTDPHGDPIPDMQGKFQPQKSVMLSQLHKGKTGIVIGVLNHSTPFLQYLDKIEAGIGKSITVEDIIIFDKSMQISINNKPCINISNEIAKNILVKEE